VCSYAGNFAGEMQNPPSGRDAGITGRHGQLDASATRTVPGGAIRLRTTQAVIFATVMLAGSANAQLDVPRYAHTTTVLPGGRVMVYGGLGPHDAFMLGTEVGEGVGAFAQGPRSHRARAFHTATVLRDGTLLIAGGFVLPYSTASTAEIFDGDRFVFLTHRMSAPRELHTATLLEDGRVLIAGGFVGGITSLAGCDLYEPGARRFVPTGGMAEERFGHAASLLRDGRVLVTGGSQYPEERTLRSAEIYDPVTGSFTAGGQMAEERSRHTQTVLHDGRVLITGGNSIGAGVQLACTEVYDPSSGRFDAGPAMIEPRMDHTATLLADGRVLIAGGFNGVGEPHTVDSCEVYDPATGRFTPLDPLPLPVHEHQATLLPDGGVLVTGGMIVADGRRSAVTETVVLRP
jgi:hypothetical protein